MRDVDLVADTDVVSYMFKGGVPGAIRARCDQVGRAISWPDAWVAATALWLRVPLVAHDRDLERIPGLRVLTVHKDWQVREESSVPAHGGALWLGESAAEAGSAAVN